MPSITKIKPLAYANGIRAETRTKMSRAATRRNLERQYTKGIGGIRSDIGHYVRSSWEANFARILLFLGMPYEYEKKVFYLTHPNGHIVSYRPDFEINNIFVEVKGWWDVKSQLKKELMSLQHPQISVLYISENEYQVLEDYYAKFIPKWEYKKRRRA